MTPHVDMTAPAVEPRRIPCPRCGTDLARWSIRDTVDHLNSCRPQPVAWIPVGLAWFAIWLAACVMFGGCAALDPTLECHGAVTRGGVGYRECAVSNGSAYIETPYGDVDCVQGRHGGPDCVRTAEVFIGGVSECIDDWADAMYAWDAPVSR